MLEIFSEIKVLYSLPLLLYLYTNLPFVLTYEKEFEEMNITNILMDAGSWRRWHIMWFHLYEVQEHVKLICGDTTENSGWKWGNISWEVACRRFLGVKMFHNPNLNGDYTVVYLPSRTLRNWTLYVCYSFTKI